MKKHIIGIVIGTIIASALIIAFFCCDGSKTETAPARADNGNITVEKSRTDESENNAEYQTDTPNEDSKSDDKGDKQSDYHKDTDSKENTEYSEENGTELDSSGKDKYKTEPVPEGKPVPAEPDDTEITDKKSVCTMSVRCDTILNNMSALNPEKTELIPKDGIIFPQQEVVFYEGESVFNLLKREMKKNKIHMEFVNTPIYNSAYIEGIANIYEYDCGELSGWMYKVNGWFPNYGCSRYKLKNGDVVEWLYTCDLGVDLGKEIPTDGEQKDE